jgi:hypothetical protein
LLAVGSASILLTVGSASILLAYYQAVSKMLTLH